MNVINPRTGQVDYKIPDQEPHEVSAVASQLRAAQIEWSECGLSLRIETLKKWRDSIARHSEAISDSLTIDTGRSAISRFEVFGILERIDYLVERAPEILGGIESGTSSMVPSVDFSYRKVPYPVAGVISPWNVPLTLALIDALPALLAGCAVLLKPSEITPRFAEPLAKSIGEVPDLAKVFKIVTGGANTGIALIDNVDVICFTGSVATGKKVAVQAAQNFIPAL